MTAANHIILYDRWWNPAVEAQVGYFGCADFGITSLTHGGLLRLLSTQAIDRAYRIGQTRSVFVHRFITRSTMVRQRKVGWGEGMRAIG